MLGKILFLRSVNSCSLAQIFDSSRPDILMRDPFRPNTNKQLVREAQFGFTVIGLLIAVLIYVAYFRINGLGDSLPQHIRDAPIAMHVFPNSPNYDRQSNMMQSRDSNPRVASTSNSPIKQKSPLVETPKRLLEDSNSTFRSLRKTAKSTKRVSD
jgi:hypothetical protein